MQFKGILIFLALSLRLHQPAAAPAVPAVPATVALIPATAAFAAPACSADELGGISIDYGFGSTTFPSPQRGNPEWKAIILDPSQPPNLQPPTIVEGFVSPVSPTETTDSQATSEVSEEELPWTHYAHDFTYKVLPDPAYQYLLASWVNYPGVTYPGITDPLICAALGGTVQGMNCVVPPDTCPNGLCQYTDMEVEWDNASLMDEKEGFMRDYGAVPEFVWPAVGDRVWASGRWIFDCGHPGTPSADPNDPQYVKFSTEIHPPRVQVTYRLNHPALDSFPVPRVSAPNFPAPQSYLPVTGQPVDPATLPPGVQNSGPTNVPLTEADIFVSVNAGAAGDICTVVPAPCSDYGGHSGVIIPVNDRNYVFDIYPPITDYGYPLPNGTFMIYPPVADVSLQWRIVDHSTELPLHACGSADGSGCVTVDPIICLIDSSTPPPDQSETGCPAVPAQPTRLRVILPFKGSNANYFAKSILLGWDNVPDPVAQASPVVRNFQVTLHNFTVKNNGEGCCTDGDWRVFVNVGGQYRYISPYYDAKPDGTSVCNGADALTNNGNGDCFQFDQTPWTVSVEDGTPIHVAVGGFIARGVEDSGSSLFMCRTFPSGCDDPGYSPLDTPWRDFPFSNDDRIGTYEFDLHAPQYEQPNGFTTTQFGCTVFSLTGCSIQYSVQFVVQEIPPATPPASGPLVIGLPSYAGPAGTYIAAATPMIPQTADPNAEGFRYRFHLQGGPLPSYPFAPPQPFPVHWAHADLAGANSVQVQIGSANAGDGPYDFQYSAESFGNLLEPRHTTTVILDTTPPVISISQPTATAYPHSAVLTLSYSVSDGSGSGVASFTPTMDLAAALPGNVGLQNGQPINLLTELALGAHTFSITATDNVNNTGTSSVTFTVIVTAQSIEDDVTQFRQSGAIDNGGIANSLLAKLESAAAKRASGNCSAAANIYSAFINDLQAQSGKHVTAAAAAIMIADAQYLISHCP